MKNEWKQSDDMYHALLILEIIFFIGNHYDSKTSPLSSLIREKEFIHDMDNDDDDCLSPSIA